MMHHFAFRDRSIVCLMYDTSTQPPNIRFRHLHERPSVVAASPIAYPFCPDRDMVVRCLARLKLGGFRYTRSLWYAVSQIAGAFRGTLIRAVVHVSTLRWFAMKRPLAYGTRYGWSLWSWPASGLAVNFSALARAVDKARLVSCEAIGLDRERLSTVAAWNIHIAQYSGTGTTLAVAHGHGRDAIGIDIDERSAELARDRVGPMFLEVVA